MTEVRPAERPQPGEPPRGETSPVVSNSSRVIHGLRVPMRDGVELALDLVRPDLPGPLPVVLQRTPYDKVAGRDGEIYRGLVERGYITAFNDCRGRFNSDGVFEPHFHEADDGHDVIEWIAAQDWCDGNVGMLGGSYAGQTQWFAASRRPPSLKAIVPYCSPPASPWRNEPIFGGCLMLGITEWMVDMGARSYQRLNPMSMLTEHQPYFNALPLTSLAEQAGARSRWLEEMLRHPTLDAYWKRRSYDHHPDADLAVLNITGWWDMNFPGAPLNFEAMRTGRAADKQKLIIGPWPHMVNMWRELSGADFGEHAVVALNDYVIRFFDRWLKGIENGIEAEKPVHVFVTGANEWWAEDEWPLRDAEEVPFYFRSRGRANSSDGDGALSTEPPGAEPADAYRYDPLDQGTRVWNMHEGPVDERPAQQRADLLCYTSEPLAEPLDVVGWVTCRLWASSSALDTDWHVRLSDVRPDGTARFLCRGALRARFRESFEEPKLLEPGEPTLFAFTMDACGVRFLPGHRIRVEVSSSGFSRYDRNTNSGADNPFDDDKIVIADQRVFHEAERASCVVLPVVRRG
ncbi:CocE/NonD family hydrolase [Nonomuraea sp. NPDC055795]